MKRTPSMSVPHHLVSILLPVFNDAYTLGRAVRSLQRQTFSQWELLLLNDGSTDSTAELMESASREDPRIRAVHLRHGGIAGALNAGLETVRGAYIARMDADDVSHPQRLALQMDYLEGRPDISAVGCGVRIFPRKPMTEGMRAYEAWMNALITPEQIAGDMFVESPLAHPSIMIRKEVFWEVGGYRSNGPEDYDLLLRLHRKGHRFGKVPRRLFWWMDRSGRTSRISLNYTQEAFRRCKAHHLVRQLGPGKRVVMIGNREAKRLAALLEAGGLRIDGYVDVNPRRVDTQYRGVPVRAYDSLKNRASGSMLLAAVGSRGAREEIRSRLSAFGYREGREFICVG